MANFNYTLLMLAQENLPRSYIIQGIYQKIITSIKFTKNDYLVEMIQLWLDDRPLNDYERFFFNWFTAPDDVLYWHNYGLCYDISVIVCFILPYYIDYSLENSSCGRLANEKYRIIQELSYHSFPPAYAIHHVHCMLDILQINCIEKSTSHSRNSFKQHQKNNQLRQLFNFYYLKYQAQFSESSVTEITEKAILTLESKLNQEITHDNVKGFATKLNNHDYLVPQRQIKMMNSSVEPKEHQIHIRKKLRTYIKSMSKISINQ